MRVSHIIGEGIALLLKCSITSEALEDETEEAELDIAASLSTESSFTCADECACDCQELYSESSGQDEDYDDIDDDDYNDIE